MLSKSKSFDNTTRVLFRKKAESIRRKKARNREERRGLESVLDTYRAKKKKETVAFNTNEFFANIQPIGISMHNAKRAQEEWGRSE
jgi:transcriptional regulator of aromatic amino acid metabolism